MSESRGAALFSIGNYQTAAEIGRPDEWQTHAALGLLGVTDAGIRGLDRFDHEEARFYSAVASWIAGDDSAAERGLEKVNTHHAQNLLALMRLPRINVLTQILDTKTGFWGLVDGIRKDPRFLVGTIPSVPGADVHDYYSSGCVPHFYISAQAEWHHIPSNIRQLPCPIFAQTGDPDIHVQIITPWLRLFDEIITTAHDEWDDARRISKVPTSVFPKLFSLYVPQLHLDPFTPRTYDVTMTGAWFHPYQTEKARILHQLYRIKGINLFTHDGYLDTASYVRLMAKTKIIVSFSRYTGCLPSRGLESLSMGCATIIPKGNVWKFFVGEEDGVFEYDPYGDDLPETVNRILGDWDAIRDRVRLGSAKVRRDFNRKRVAGQYMRYLAFLAAKPRQRSRPPQPIPPQKRLIYWRGGFQGDFETCEARRLQLAKNASPTLCGILDLARELALAVADVAENPTLGQSSSNAHLFGMISRLLRLYRLGIKKYPESLVMRLNFVRVALHLGSPHHASEGLSLCKETLQKPETTWKIDAMEDVFPYDFFSQFFNYRAYFDSVTEHLKNGAHVEHTLICLIMASLHHYAGHYVDALPHFQAAVKLDPAFFRYKLSLARALLSIGDPQDRESAKKLLLGLADDSWLFGDAYRLLEQNWPKDFSTSTRFKEISNVAAIEAKTVSHSSRSHPFDVWGASPLRPIKSD